MKLKTTLALVGAAASTLAATHALAQAAPPASIAPKMQTCLACHVVEGKKTVGPTYKEVSAKYAGQKDAEKMLVQSVIKGSQPGKLKWGQVPMPPNAVSEADATAMVKWVLSLK
jgi:cytochrome c